MSPSSNFSFLAEHDPLFVELASAAERAFSSDPNTTLMKLRQLGEALAQHLAARIGLTFDSQTSQLDLLHRLNRELSLDPAIRELFHLLRTEGNKATHEFQTKHRDAMKGLVVARKLAVWFHQSFGKAGTAFKAGPFVPPTDPSVQLTELQGEITRLKGQLKDANEQLGSSQQLDELIAQEKAEYEALLDTMEQEAKAQAKQTQQQEAELARQQKDYEAKIQTLQQQLAEQSAVAQQQRQQVSHHTKAASEQLGLDESLTRILIDESLQRAGWEADSLNLTHKQGARPEKGRNQAIAEWPTQNGRADYVLFAGFTPLAVVEAKRETINVAGRIDQAERYSRDFTVADEHTPAWQSAPWADGTGRYFQLPFVYSCNGRPYVPQLKEQSGTWFRDVRQPANLKRPLQEFHSPSGLLDLLKKDKDRAEQQLANEPFGYLKLRDYQVDAIAAAESALAAGRRELLIAMATGTGKTRAVTGLMYRLLKSQRFNRILFLVDRTTLGEQATETFTETPLEQNQTLATTYNIAELGDMRAEAETRIQVATVQAMVKRVFINDEPPPIDQFDCIIIDEAHRGYTLDQEMTEGELAIRDASQYLSSYRRVLDYFDAVKIGLTATPAKHTSEIFGKPIYTYSYRDAVADDWLIDYEPPLRYTTELSQNGIHFDKGETVSQVKLTTGEIDTAELDDELDFEVETFNSKVLTDNFNQVICEALAQRLDPEGRLKTLIFCANDRHADIIKDKLDAAFKAMHGDYYNQAAVAKITGQSDQVKKLIRQYKNEPFPNIAITVDLLTTGVDVPAIGHLVFLRRVRSRILFEQMIGRATRRCDEFGKTVITIHDPVGLFSALEDVNTMKPLVKDPNISLQQLVSELTDDDTRKIASQHTGAGNDETQADVILSQICQKLMRVLRQAEAKAERIPKLREQLDELHQNWQVAPKELHKHLKAQGPEQAANFLKQHSRLVGQLELVQSKMGGRFNPVISEHDDRLIEVKQTYGDDERPEDYLESFNHFVRQQINESAALAVVVKRPRDLTRQQLREIRLLLDENGYSETFLRSATRSQTNKDIAASIIGYIRQAALGEPLVPFQQRVDQAMERIYQNHPWSPVQRQWLDRLSKQLVHEVVFDRDFVNYRFGDDGGAQRIDRILDDQLDTVLDELKEALWASD